MSEIFITSDNHFSHGGPGHRTGILKHTRRPWNTIEEHDAAMMKLWNDVVPRKATVYIVGDFAWKNHGKWISCLHGKKILITGSHDHMSKEIAKNFTEVHPCRMISLDGQRIYLQHCAPRVWERSHYGCPCFFGHSHGRLRTFNLSRDIGVDTEDANYMPFEWHQLKSWIATRTEEMRSAGRIKTEDNGRVLWRQDDVSWALNNPDGYREEEVDDEEDAETKV
jgi:calcineurin-like phosphoesterase family protein